MVSGGQTGTAAVFIPVSHSVPAECDAHVEAVLDDLLPRRGGRADSPAAVFAAVSATAHHFAGSEVDQPPRVSAATRRGQGDHEEWPLGVRLPVLDELVAEAPQPRLQSLVDQQRARRDRPAARFGPPRRGRLARGRQPQVAGLVDRAPVSVDAYVAEPVDQRVDGRGQWLRDQVRRDRPSPADRVVGDLRGVPDLEVPWPGSLPLAGEGAGRDSRSRRQPQEPEDARGDRLRVRDQILIPDAVTFARVLVLHGQNGTDMIHPVPRQREDRVPRRMRHVRLEPIVVQPPRAGLHPGSDHVHRMPVQADELRLRVHRQQRFHVRLGT